MMSLTRIRLKLLFEALHSESPFITSDSTTQSFKYAALCNSRLKGSGIFAWNHDGEVPIGIFAYTINLPGLVHDSAVAWIENKSLRVNATVMKRGKEQFLEYELLLPKGNYSRYTIGVEHFAELEYVVVYVTGVESHHNIDMIIDRKSDTIVETNGK
ncbi:hypothetical protein Tco_0701885 [Tanacetum coccineum]|uniref:Uncharacterized protein n=1 Tax=Tanacetum coccineum TaxID=301880 RepID=A0ABQ4XUQ0_9ASTR